jgi:hypothetical protein
MESKAFARRARFYSLRFLDGLTSFTVNFADLPSGHGNEWKRARKTLTLTQAGFEERLEVDVGSVFTPSYVIREKTHS